MRKPVSIIVSYKYAVETSPTVKNLAALLNDCGQEVVIIIDMFYRNVQFTPDYARVVSLKDNLPLNALRLINRIPFGKQALTRFFMQRQLKHWMKKADHLFLVEGVSLLEAANAGADLKKAAFMFLENTQIVLALEPKEPKILDYLKACSYHVIQSAQRGADVNQNLRTHFAFHHLPVSLRPVALLPQAPSEKLKIVFSGYFAPWSQVLESLELVHRLRTHLPLHVTLRGHIVGDSDYLDLVKAKIETLALHDIVHLDTSYMDDAQHTAMLADHHIGIALYGPAESDNWENLIFSSGKIATYLWAGLNVITDVDDTLTERTPFFNLNQLDDATLVARLQEVLAAPETYRAHARATAAAYYDFDAHAHGLLEKMNIQPAKGTA